MTWGMLVSEAGSSVLYWLKIRPRLSRPISRIVRKSWTEPSRCTTDRSTLMTPVNGALGIGVTKIS